MAADRSMGVKPGSIKGMKGMKGVVYAPFEKEQRYG